MHLCQYIHQADSIETHSKGILDVAYYPEYLRPAHRLDANTTGLVVLGEKTKLLPVPAVAVHQCGTVKKTYLATVIGHPSWDQSQCDLPIGTEPLLGGGRCIDPNGQSALTRFRLLERLQDGTALIEAVPETGRTHQIRLHLAAMGFPIQNDPLYLAGGSTRNAPESEMQTQAMGLHAWKLEFVHPITREVVFFEAEPAKRCDV